MSNAISPSVTYPSPNEWPNTIRQITGITRAARALITSPSHGFTTADNFITQVMFQQVKGMIQINGLPALITNVIDENTFEVALNTSQFFTYTSGGIANVLTGQPPTQTVGQQTFNTPFQNIA